MTPSDPTDLRTLTNAILTHPEVGGAFIVTVPTPSATSNPNPIICVAYRGNILGTSLVGLVAAALSTTAFTNDNRGGDHQRDPEATRPRPPLLLIAGEQDRIIPASLNRKNYERYQASPALTSFQEFPGRDHWLIASSGWQEVADYALAWLAAP